MTEELRSTPRGLVVIGQVKKMTEKTTQYPRAGCSRFVKSQNVKKKTEKLRSTPRGLFMIGRRRKRLKNCAVPPMEWPIPRAVDVAVDAAALRRAHEVVTPLCTRARGGRAAR